MKVYAVIMLHDVINHNCVTQVLYSKEADRTHHSLIMADNETQKAANSISNKCLSIITVRLDVKRLCGFMSDTHKKVKCRKC